MIFFRNKLDKVPDTWRYVIAIAIICVPILLCIFCCRCKNSVEETKRANPGVKKVQPGSPKKKAQKIE